MSPPLKKTACLIDYLVLFVYFFFFSIYLSHSLLKQIFLLSKKFPVVWFCSANPTDRPESPDLQSHRVGGLFFFFLLFFTPHMFFFVCQSPSLTNRPCSILFKSLWFKTKILLSRRLNGGKDDFFVSLSQHKCEGKSKNKRKSREKMGERCHLNWCLNL